MYRLGKLRGKFCVVWYEDGKRHRHSLGTADRKEAERLLRHFGKQPEPRVDYLWSQYLHEKAGIAVTVTMVHTWKALGPTFGHLDPSTIDVDLCRSYTARRRALGRSDGTIHTELGHLRTVLNWAVKRGHIERAAYIERPPKPEPRGRYLTREEAQKLLDGAATHHIRLAVVLLLATAARVEAIRELTWSRVDFERGLIHLRDPNDRSRRKGRATVPMNSSTRAALAHARLASLSDYVIEWAGKPVASLKKGFATASKHAGLEAVSAAEALEVGLVHLNQR